MRVGYVYYIDTFKFVIQNFTFSQINGGSIHATVFTLSKSSIYMLVAYFSLELQQHVACLLGLRYHGTSLTFYARIAY